MGNSIKTYTKDLKGRAIAQAVCRRLPSTGFEPESGHVGFVVDKVAMGQIFSCYFSFPYQFAFHRLLHNHHLSSGASTIDKTVAAVPSGLSLTSEEKKKDLKRNGLTSLHMLLTESVTLRKDTSFPYEAICSSVQ
jgi:hypothetical protein